MNITPDQPGDAKQRRIRANAISGKCSKCGQPVLRSNLANLKDGQALCPTCHEEFMDELFA